MGFNDGLPEKEQACPEKTAVSKISGSNLPREESDIEKAIAERASHLGDYKKFPLGDIAALGGIFAELSPALRTMSQTVKVDSVGYIPINLGEATLKQFSKNTPEIFVGAFNDITTGKSTMVQWVKANPQMITAGSTLPINPMMMAMAVMMLEINRKLDAIQKTQQEILSFLQEDKKAKLQGDLNMLMDILDKYRFNWDNEQYRNNYHMKILDIKQNAEQDIIFYQKQIAARIRKLPPIFLDNAVRGMMDNIADYFHDYSMALYIFSFASYLEVMLLGNFSAEYLRSVAQRVCDYQTFYREQFDKCREYVGKVSGDSVQMKVQDSVGQVGKFLGNLIGSSPLLSKGPVDEWLIEGGEQLLKDKADRMAGLVEELEKKQVTGSEIFVDSIRNVGTVCNDTRAIMFDQDNLYLAT